MSPPKPPVSKTAEMKCSAKSIFDHLKKAYGIHIEESKIFKAMKDAKENIEVGLVSPNVELRQLVIMNRTASRGLEVKKEEAAHPTQTASGLGPFLHESCILQFVRRHHQQLSLLWFPSNKEVLSVI
ncbi:hypothetical protein VNO78_20321 [Psophocarpus tetragonolobus]|uniref:Uncharacterized protein n=1 Tax=Psophocarpus tetragonolobus TaxID=3891 RepID=A0AAN9XHE0_PSOTE